RRVAGEAQLGKDDDVYSTYLCLANPRRNQSRIAADITDRGVDLGKRETKGHSADLDRHLLRHGGLPQLSQRGAVPFIVSRIAKREILDAVAPIQRVAQQSPKVDD